MGAHTDLRMNVVAHHQVFSDHQDRRLGHPSVQGVGLSILLECLGGGCDLQIKNTHMVLD